MTHFLTQAIASLPPGKTITLKYAVTIQSNGETTISNTATITGDNFSPVTAIDTETGPGATITKVSVLPQITGISPTVGFPGGGTSVVITGSKTDTQLKDLPASVVVVPSELLRQQGTVDMNRAMENASGVQPVQGGAYGFANNYSIRGMAMRFLRDGLPDGTSQNGYWRTMYDIDRIEVLKGPGSALYGSGQPGGTVNVVTKQPRARFGSEIGALAGSFGTWGVYADTTGAIGVNLSARLVADAEKSDGFRGLGRNIKEISPTFTWALADDKTLTLDFDHREIKVKPDNYGVLFDARGNIAAPRDARFYSPMSDTDQTINRVTLSHEWRINADLTMRTAVLNDDRDLHLTRNAGTNGGNVAGVVTGRQLRDQNDDTRFSMLQNEVVWKTSTGAIKHTLLTSN